MGKLDRNRTFIIKEHSADVKVPTDLLGITPLTYLHPNETDLSLAIRPACTELQKAIKKLGPR